MAGFRNLALLALSGTQVWTASAEEQPSKRQDATAKYCPGDTPICFSEYTVGAQGLIYRIAIPDVQSAPFDILLQIVAPKTVGWAGLAWGGKMSNNPLTVAWSNGNSAVVSSRWTSGKSLPGAYTGAKYTTLPTTTSNATHWQLDVLCQGCSQWQGGSLNPNGVNGLAWAKANRAVPSPSSNTSSFSAHDAKAIFAHDFSQAKIPKGVFDAVAYDLQDGVPGASSAPPPAVVQTSVVTLPRPVSSVLGPLPVPTRLTALPDPDGPASTILGPLPIPTRLTVLPDPNSRPPVMSATRTRIVTSVTQLVPKPPGRTTTVIVFPPRVSTTVVTVVVPPTQTAGPPWQGGGGGGGWGGKGKGKGKWGGGGGRGGGPGRGRGRPGEEEGEE